MPAQTHEDEPRLCINVTWSQPVVSRCQLLVCVALSLCVAGCSDEILDIALQLESSDVKVRRAAARSLGERSDEAAAAVGSLVSALDDEDPHVRRLCSSALGKIGIREDVVCEALRNRLDDDELAVRMAAAFALQRIDPREESFVPVLCEAMRMGEGGTIVAVGEMEPAATWAIPTLVKLLQDRRAGIRRLAAETLGRIGVQDDEVVSALNRLLLDDDDRVREAARNALGPTQLPPD